MMVDNKTNNALSVHELLAGGNVENALKLLVEHSSGVDAALADDATLLLSRWRTVQREADLGTITQETASVQQALLTRSALHFSRRLTSQIEYSPRHAETPHAFEAPSSVVTPNVSVSEPKTIRTVRLFLASSAELRDDRDAFELFVRQQTDRLRTRGLYFEVVRWEYFLDAVSDTRLQDEYNVEVRRADIFVSLFFTKSGKFTEEEFDVAHKQFKETGKPRIYTYFKNATIKCAFRST